MAAAQDPAAGQTAESRAQRRILLVLVLGQVLAGLGTGASLRAHLRRDTGMTPLGYRRVFREAPVA